MDKGWTRNLFVQVHRYTGLVLFAFLALAASTGCLLVFKDGLDRALNPDLFSAPNRAAILPAAALVKRLQAERPELVVASIPVRIEPGQAVPASVTARTGHASLSYDQVFLDPHDGAVLSVRATRPGWDRRHLIQGLYLLHYTLLAGDPGRWFMGVVALAWVIENGVGFYLTLPRGGPFWRKWRPIWQVNFRAPLPRVLLDLHRASGLWLFIGVTILALTSAAMNFYGEVFEPAVVALSPPARSPWDAPPLKAAAGPSRIDFAQAERLAVADAGRDRVNLRPAVLTYDPERRLIGVRFTDDGREQYAGLGPISYYYDAVTGRRAFVDNPMTDSAGEKALRSLFPLHSGQVGGLVTRLLDILLGLSILEMSITGLIVWWKKRKPRMAARAARDAATSKAAAALRRDLSGGSAS